MQQNDIDTVTNDLQRHGFICENDVLSYEDLLRNVSDSINHLIVNDFEKLVQLLYRLDVSEEKVRTLLKNESDQQASNLIAQLIIQRQLQKVQLRSSSTNAADIAEDERW